MLTKLTYSFLQYGLNRDKEAINELIENAISEAENKGAKVVSLGLLNQVRHLFGYLKYLYIMIREQSDGNQMIISTPLMYWQEKFFSNH